MQPTVQNNPRPFPFRNAKEVAIFLGVLLAVGVAIRVFAANSIYDLLYGDVTSGMATASASVFGSCDSGVAVAKKEDRLPETPRVVEKVALAKGDRSK